MAKLHNMVCSIGWEDHSGSAGASDRWRRGARCNQHWKTPSINCAGVDHHPGFCDPHPERETSPEFRTCGFTPFAKVTAGVPVHNDASGNCGTEPGFAICKSCLSWKPEVLETTQLRGIPGLIGQVANIHSPCTCSARRATAPPACTSYSMPAAQVNGHHAVLNSMLDGPARWLRGEGSVEAELDPVIMGASSADPLTQQIMVALLKAPCTRCCGTDPVRARA